MIKSAQKDNSIKPKLKDIADITNVSISTVSLALAGKGRISADVRKRVLDAARDLGYGTPKRPPSASRERGRPVAIIVSIDEVWAFIWGFIRPIIEEIEQNLKRDGWNTVLIPTHRSLSDEEVLERIIDARVEAVISLHYGSERVFRSLEDMDIPTIVVMNGKYQDQFYSVLVDDIQCAYEGVNHLISLGHRKLGYVECGRPDLPILLNDRFFGFRKAIDEAGIVVPERHIIRYELSEGEKLIRGLTSWYSGAGQNRPTGIFCLDDDVALRVITVLGGLDVRVPEDVAIIAPGDVLDYSEDFTPKITTMKINTTYMGKIIYQMLANRLEHRPEDLHVLKVKHQLVRRGTCCADEGT